MTECEVFLCSHHVTHLARVQLTDIGRDIDYYLCEDHATGRAPIRDGRVISARRVKKSKLRKTLAKYVPQGTRFYLTEDGKFGDTYVQLLGFGERDERDYETGELTGRKIRTVVYKGELGFRDEIPWDFEVWVKDV